MQVKKSKLALVVGMGMLVLSSFAHADDSTVSSGTVDFEGTVVNTPCTLNGDNTAQTVQLGEVTQSQMQDTGSKSASTPFSIQLEQCDSTVAQTASFAFTGQADANDATSLSNEDSGNDAATNVAVQVTDASNTVIPIDGTDDTGAALTLKDGTNIANFNAYMISAAGSATAGKVHSTMTFVVTYA